MELVLGIDLGTSYFKVGLFNREGALRGLGRVAIDTQAPQPGWQELSVESFRSAVRQGVRLALGEAGGQPGDVRAMGYSSQASSFVLLDGDDRPLTGLLLWTDSRADGTDPAVRDLWSRDDFLPATGLGTKVANQVMPMKLRWLQEHQPDLWARTQRIMTLSDLLTWSLTGRRAGDAGTASLLGLWNLPEAHWWPEAMTALGVTEPMLSEPLRPGTLAGEISAAGADAFGLPEGIPLLVGSLDHHVAAMGAGAGHLAEVSESTGTVLACLRLLKTYEPKANCVMGPGRRDGTFYQLAWSTNGAVVLDWYRKTHAPQYSVGELVSRAAGVSPGCNGLTALPDAHEREGLSGFEGVSPAHGPGHFARAIMESVVRDLVGLVDYLCPDGRPKTIVATGGGARSDLWLQLKADALGATFIRTACREPACLGAAMLASVAAGWHDDIPHAGETWLKVDCEFTPTR